MECQQRAHHNAIKSGETGGALLIGLGRLARDWAGRVNPWTNVYGLARCLLAAGTLGTLIFSHSKSLFRPAVGYPQFPFCTGPAEISLFCLFPKDKLEIARWLAIGILLIVVSGWRPRLTGVLHWWVSFSLQTSAITLDGGDQVTAILTLLLLPVTLTDGRRWHWQRVSQAPPAGWERLMRLLALSALTAIRIQVAGIYFHSSIAKFNVEEWANGTALYYWLTDPTFGVPGWLKPLVEPLLIHGVTVTLLTWGALVTEVLLFLGLVMPKAAWRGLLVMGIVFHSAIAASLGLVSFAMAMMGALVLYLRPVERQFSVELGVHAPSRQPLPTEVARPEIRMGARPSTLLYDADCGFCRWSVAQLLRWDRRGSLRPITLQDPIAGILLVGINSAAGMASWHLVTPDGRVYSAGKAVPVLLRLLPGGRPIAALAAAFPGLTDLAYRWIARKRHGLSRKLRMESCAIEPDKVPPTGRKRAPTVG